MKGTEGLYSDLTDWALSLVNWEDVASGYMDEIIKESEATL